MSVSSATSPLLEHQHQRLAPLLQIGDPQARLARLVEAARHHPPLEPALRLETNRIEGCLVRVWFVAEMRAKSPPSRLQQILAERDAQHDPIPPG